MLKNEIKRGKIDISGAKWDFSREEKYVIKWLEDNGFTGKIVKQYISKTIFEIAKDGITDRFELPQGIVFKDIRGYMEQYKKNWELKLQVIELRNEVNRR